MTIRRFFRALAAALCFCVWLGSIPAQAAQKAPLRFWVASDLHYYSAADLGDMQGQYTEHMLQPEMFGYASTQGQMQYESRAIVQSFLDDFVRSDADCLLIPGDLTGGKRQSHLELAAMLRRVQQQSGKRVFVINGNHDCVQSGDEKKISMQEFREIYRAFGYDRAQETHDGSASYTAELGGGYRLLAIDSCIYGEDEGKINRQVYAFIRRQIRQAEADGVKLIAMMHHSILPHYALQPMIPRYAAIAAMLADNGVQVVLTGHIHANDVTSRKSLRGNTLYDVQTGSLITTPNAYRRVCVQDGRMDMTCGYVRKIDTRLLPAGFSAQQKAWMERDFPGYARTYLEEGVCKFLNRNIGSAYRVARLLKLPQGSKGYAAADRLMHRLGDAVGLDIYAGGDAPSIESVLAPFGVRVPESRYRKPYQAAADVMYGFFRGDEGTVTGSADVTLVRVCLEGAVQYAAETALTRGEQDALIKALCRTVPTRDRDSLLHRACGVIADAILRELTKGMSSDYAPPGDITLTIS